MTVDAPAAEGPSERYSSLIALTLANLLRCRLSKVVVQMTGSSLALRFVRCGLALGTAIAIASISGCSLWRGEAPLRSSVSEQVGTGLPAEGASVCLESDGRNAALEVLLRSAVVDRGYRVVMQQSSARGEDACRFFVVLRASRARLGEMPKSISLDFRDVYTGETQRAQWRREEAAAPRYLCSGHGSQGSLTGADGASNALIAGPYGDPAMIMRSLVDQLFPSPAARWLR